MELQLNETQKELLRQADLRLMTLYMLPDICEALLQDILDYRKKAGVRGFKFEQKKYWNAFQKDAYNLRKASYADMCDLIQNLILLIIDRCGKDDMNTLMRFISYMKSFPSRRNIELTI